jgi:DNA polymerase-3 subunit epsilon/ATP-dependent DNA helicase DinG
LAGTFIALDLETTGLDLENDAIIEIGAVRFDDSGAVIETYEALVNPGRPLPAGVQDLTGITERDLAEAPPLFLLAPQIQAFIGDAPLVGHNVVGFDSPFLTRAGIITSPHLYDTQDIASLLLPGLPEYSLAALAESFGIEFPVRHRALADAQATRALFLGLCEKARVLPADVLAQVAQWLAPTEYPWRTFFARMWESASVSGANGRLTLKAPTLPPPLYPVKDPQPVDPRRPLEVLASAAGRPDIFPEFDDRPQQQEMSSAVTAALNEGRRLLVEAGTGTGKSLAYLIPAACHAIAGGERVVVSTATINLQEQLTKKDIPTLQELMTEGGLRACQLKGRRNYLCLKQFQVLRDQPVLDDAEALLASRVLIWLCGTETGDRAELRLTPAEDAVWTRISADKQDCTSETSPFVVNGTCFLQRARKQAEGSHVVVVNHALLLSDTATGGHVLPPYQHLVIDEAHHLEDEATRQFGFATSERLVSEMLGRCEALQRSVQPGLQAAAAGSASLERLASCAAGLRQAAASAAPRLTEFGQACVQFLSQHSEEGSEYDQRLHVNRSTRAQPDWVSVEMAWENLKLPLGTLADGLDRLLALLTGPEAFGLVNQELIVAEVSGLLSEIQEVRNGVAAAIEKDDPQRVIWLERDRADGGITVSWVPLAVAGLLREQLYGERASIVLTGATLRTQGSFSYMQERLGLEDAGTLALGSPFDFKRAALVLLPRDMPEPNWPEYSSALSQAVVGLTRASRGRALVLFTSHANLRAVHGQVEPILRREGIIALGQGIDGSPRQLVRALQANPEAVILGTSSFWEGVDIAGETLSLIIMARLPFNVPTEPVFAARSALYDDPFNQYGLPQAVLRFKQGFGRLIRTKTDRGVLVVLDRRILSKTYGAAFTDSLPPCTFRHALLREMPALVEGWLAARIPAG